MFKPGLVPSGRSCFLLWIMICWGLEWRPLNAQDSVVHYKEQELNFTYKDNKLYGKLITPSVYKGRLPVIVFIHGSGPEDYSSSGNYRYLWETFTEMGFACYSWNRPGVNPSQGKWYQMSVADRADEVIEAVRQLRKSSILDTSKMGFWGISQAGWVIPKVAETITPAFIITVSSPVTTAYSQECYRVKSEMGVAGFSAEEIRKAIAYNEELRTMIKTGKPYRQFMELQKRTAHEKWSEYVIRGDEMVYDYLSIVFSNDSPPDLSSLRCPVLAVWGVHDLLVPPQTSADSYRKALKRIGNRNVLIRIIPDADHTLTWNRTGARAETLRRRAQYAHNPAAVFAPGYIQLMKDWLAGLNLK